MSMYSIFILTFPIFLKYKNVVKYVIKKNYHPFHLLKAEFKKER